MINSLSKQHKNGDFKANVIKLMGGTFGAQLIVIVTLPLLTRLFSPEAFGQAAIYTAIIAILVMLTCGRYEMAIPLPKSDRRAADIVLLCILLVTAVSTLGFVGIFTYLLIAHTYFAIPYNHYLWLIPIGVFIGGIYVVLTNWGVRTKSFSAISVNKVAVAAITALSQILFAMAGLVSGIFLFIAQIQGNLIGVIGFVAQIRAKLFHLCQTSNRLRLYAVLKKYKDFPKYTIFSSLLGAGAWRLPVLIFGLFYSPYYVGMYVLGFRVFQMPVSLISNTVSRVFFQKIAEGKGKNNILVESLASDMGGLVLVLFVFISMSGQSLFSFIFGAEWSEAGWYAQILSPWAFVWFITASFTPIFAVLGQQKLQLRLNAINFFMRLAVIVLGGIYFDIQITILLLSIFGFVMYFYRLIVLFSLVNASLYRVAKSIAAHLIYAIPISLIGYFGNQSSMLLIFSTLLMIATMVINFIYIYKYKGKDIYV
jgi:lipopolysaccharide exporter